jgi:hypothetical protein
VLPSSLQATPAPQEPSPSRLVLAKGTAPVGGKVVLPAYLTPGEGKEIGSVSLKLSFPAGSLKFGNVELVGIAEQAGATVTTKETSGNGQYVLEITIATPERAGVRSPLPSGSVAYVTFEVPPEAAVGALLALKVEATAAATKSDAGAIELEAPDSEVTVSDAAVIACLFYMH